jgi:hypothetical protein
MKSHACKILKFSQKSQGSFGARMKALEKYKAALFIRKSSVILLNFRTQIVFRTRSGLRKNNLVRIPDRDARIRFHKTACWFAL